MCWLLMSNNFGEFFVYGLQQFTAYKIANTRPTSLLKDACYVAVLFGSTLFCSSLFGKVGKFDTVTLLKTPLLLSFIIIISFTA